MIPRPRRWPFSSRSAMVGRGRHAFDRASAVQVPSPPWFLPLLDTNLCAAPTWPTESDGRGSKSAEITGPPEAVPPRGDVVGQLRLLRLEKQELHAALGTSSVADIVALAKRLQVEDLQRSQQLSLELHDLQADRDLLYATLERTCSPEVIALVTGLRTNLAELLVDSRRHLDMRREELEELSRRSMP